MTYEDNDDRAIEVLNEQRKQQELIAARGDSDTRFFDGLLREAKLKAESAKALIGAIDKALDALYARQPEELDELDTDPFTGEVEEPAEEDPYDVAFAKTDTVEPSKTETFGRAPLMGEPGF